MTTLTRRTTTVHLYQGDDLARIEELRLAAERGESETSKPRLMGEPSPAQEHDDFVAEAEGRAVKVVLAALPRKQWRGLVTAHPPRDGNEADKALGVNEDDFGEALVATSIIEPAFASDSDRDAFLDDLRFADFDRLYSAAFALNRGRVADPKADLSSRLARNSATT